MQSPLSLPVVLVIDDDDMTRMACKKILAKEGYDVIEASNGADGLALYKQHKPEIVVTDILMPEVEGLETIHGILEQGEEVRIIAMSGGGSTQNMTYLKLAQHVGASCVLQKPLKPATLLEAVKGKRRTALP